MLWQAIKAARDLGRVQDIATVLIRHGFGDLVQRIGMAGALERAGRRVRRQPARDHARLEPPERICRVLEELGPAFVKLGQLLATRVDLFPPEWTEAFARLQDQVPPVPFETLRPQLCEDLGAEPETVFSDLNPVPLACGSLAQAHEARLADGTPVILKIRRPGIRPVVEADLRLLTRLARIIEKETPDLARYRLPEVVRQLTLSLRRELDFAAECRSAERIAANLAARPEIVIPRVYWEWTCERLNVQERINGIPGRRVDEVDAAGLDRALLARRGAEAVLQMILEDGLFHADPHPGNLFYLSGERIALIDFGMVGRLSEPRRYQLASLLNGVVLRDAEAASEVLLDWAGADTDADELRTELDAFIEVYHGVPLKSLNVAVLLSDMLAVLRDHEVALPPDLSLMLKTFVTLEGLGRQLDPGFDMAGVAAPFLRRVMLNYNSPEALVKRGWHAVVGTLDLMAGLPRDMRRLLRAARRGSVSVQVEIQPLRQFGDQIDRAFSRLTLGIVTAALIVGSSIVMTVGEAGGRGLPTFALLGFIGAVLGGVAVLISIWRSGRH